MEESDKIDTTVITDVKRSRSQFAPQVLSLISLLFLSEFNTNYVMEYAMQIVGIKFIEGSKLISAQNKNPNLSSKLILLTNAHFVK